MLRPVNYVTTKFVAAFAKRTLNTKSEALVLYRRLWYLVLLINSINIIILIPGITKFRKFAQLREYLLTISPYNVHSNCDTSRYTTSVFKTFGDISRSATICLHVVVHAKIFWKHTKNIFWKTYLPHTQCRILHIAK